MKIFLVYVVVASNALKNVKAKIAELLAPYAKALQVPEYEAQCPCVHAQVEAKAREMAGAGVSTVDLDARSPFERVTSTAQAFQDSQKAAVQELLDKAVPDPKCRLCGGSGVVKTTANPNGKWNRWEIGDSVSPNLLAPYMTDVVDNPDIVPVKLLNLDEVPVPWVIVTPDGTWHAAGEPYWFGTARIDDPNWDTTARNILKQHTDATLVVVECQS